MLTSKELIYLPASGPDRRGYIRRVRALFAKYLAANGLRLTAPRSRILDFLLEADRHLSQEDIYQALRPHGLGRATVFRTLKMLHESRLINNVIGTSGMARFEVSLERPHHDHLICICCGRILEVRWPSLEAIQERTCRKFGFLPKWHRHEIFGICKSCSRKEA